MNDQEHEDQREVWGLETDLRRAVDTVSKFNSKLERLSLLEDIMFDLVAILGVEEDNIVDTVEALHVEAPFNAAVVPDA